MRQRSLWAIGAVLALTVTACSSEVDEGSAQEAEATEETAEQAADDEGIVDDTAESQSEPTEEAAPEITIVGGLVLTPEWSLVTDNRCLPLVPEQDLHDRIYPLTDEPQAQVLDASGTIVGTAQIEATVSSDGDACVFIFETTVPGGGGFYSVTVESFTTDAVAESDAQDGEIMFNLADDF